MSLIKHTFLLAIACAAVSATGCVADPTSEEPTGGDVDPQLETSHDTLAGDVDGAPSVDDFVAYAGCTYNTFRTVRNGCCSTKSYRLQKQWCNNRNQWVPDPYHIPNYSCVKTTNCAQ